MYAVWDRKNYEFEFVGANICDVEKHISYLINECFVNPDDIEVFERRDDFDVKIRIEIITPETPKQKKAR